MLHLSDISRLSYLPTVIRLISRSSSISSVDWWIWDPIQLFLGLPREKPRRHDLELSTFGPHFSPSSLGTGHIHVSLLLIFQPLRIRKLQDIAFEAIPNAPQLERNSLIVLCSVANSRPIRHKYHKLPERNIFTGIQWVEHACGKNGNPTDSRPG